jgi:hypothetical protein
MEREVSETEAKPPDVPENPEESKFPEFGEFLELNVAGKTWKLGRVGYGLRLDAAEEIRKQRRIEFKHVLESLSGMEGPHKDAAVLTAFENLLRNVSVSMWEIKAWLGSPAGEFYQLFKAIQAADAAASRESALQFYDGLTPTQLAECQKFTVVKMIGE